MERRDDDPPVEPHAPLGIRKPERRIGRSPAVADRPLEHRVQQRQVDAVELYVGTVITLRRLVVALDDGRLLLPVRQFEQRALRIEIPFAAENRIAHRNVVHPDIVEGDIRIEHAAASAAAISAEPLVNPLMR